jgi:hypothetical protein
MSTFNGYINGDVASVGSSIKDRGNRTDEGDRVKAFRTRQATFFGCKVCPPTFRKQDVQLQVHLSLVVVLFFFFVSSTKDYDVQYTIQRQGSL